MPVNPEPRAISAEEARLIKGATISFEKHFRKPLPAWCIRDLSPLQLVDGIERAICLDSIDELLKK
jgi:hypothetical protein